MQRWAIEDTHSGASKGEAPAGGGVVKSLESWSRLHARPRSSDAVPPPLRGRRWVAAAAASTRLYRRGERLRRVACCCGPTGAQQWRGDRAPRAQQVPNLHPFWSPPLGGDATTSGARLPLRGDAFDRQRSALIVIVIMRPHYRARQIHWSSAVGRPSAAQYRRNWRDSAASWSMHCREQARSAS